MQFFRVRWVLLLSVAALAVSITECVRAQRDDQFVARTAAHVVAAAKATTPRQQVEALRAFLRSRITYDDSPQIGRPFFRANAGEVIQRGHGWCGDGTRAFIRMASHVGIEAYRINLYGDTPHVVAAVEVEPGKRRVVDCQQPPMVANLDLLEDVVSRKQFYYYSTLNLRRLGLPVRMVHLESTLGALTFITEQPHLMKAVAWALVSIGISLMTIVLRLRLWKSLGRKVPVAGRTEPQGEPT